MLDPSRLAFAEPTEIGQIVMNLLTVMQSYRHESQAHAVALLFLLLTKKYNTHPSELLQSASNLLNRYRETAPPEIRAAVAYIENEIG